MIQIPVLQPHLTGVHGVENEDNRNNSIGLLSRTEIVRIRDWKLQAKELTQKSKHETFKSFALYAEAKLKENSISKPSHEGQKCTQERHSIAVYCQILKEMTASLGPLSNVFETIVKKLIAAIYSQECVSIDGSLTFDQIPYFEVAERLKKQIEELINEKSALEQDLLNTQTSLQRAEQDLFFVKSRSSEMEVKIDGLAEALSESLRAQDVLQSEADLVKEQIIALRSENMKQKATIDELVSTKESLVTKISVITNTSNEDRSNQKETEIERLEQGVQVIEEPTLELRFLNSRGISVRDLLIFEPPPDEAQLNSVLVSTNKNTLLLPNLFRKFESYDANELTLKQTQEKIHLITRNKKCFEMDNGIISLHTFILQYFLQENKFMQETMEDGCSFLKSCQKYSGQCNAINCFWKMLQGQLTEAALAGLESYGQALECFVNQLDTVTYNRLEDWTDILQQGLQIFAPSLKLQEIWISIKNLKSPSLITEKLIDSLKWNYLEMSEDCFISLIKNLKEKSIMENNHNMIHIDDLHSVIKSEDLSNSDQIYWIIQHQILTTFGDKIERISLAFVKEIIRSQILLTYEDFQNLDEVLAFFSMIRLSNQRLTDSVKSLPDMA